MVNLQQTAVFFTTTEAAFTISFLNQPPNLLGWFIRLDLTFLIRWRFWWWIQNPIFTGIVLLFKAVIVGVNYIPVTIYFLVLSF
jgi:hypothetical protein